MVFYRKARPVLADRQSLALSQEEVAWLHLAEPAFDFWDNPEDGAYDAL